MDITVFIDESGTIPHKMDGNDYFIIAMLFTDDPLFLKKVFKKERLKIANKVPKLKKLLSDNGEIKGSEISESRKSPIYEKLTQKCIKNFEIGVILLDLKTCDMRMRNNSARTFNFLIKRYLETYFKQYSKFRNFETMNFVVDERNVSPDAKYVLEDYLNIELNLASQFSENEMSVEYVSSRKFINIQLIDFIANTFNRCHQKHDPDGSKNVTVLKNVLCNSKEYKFPLT